MIRFAIALLLLIPSLAWGACGGTTTVNGDTYTAYDASQDCVVLAISDAEAAGYNKTVVVPAGTPDAYVAASQGCSGTSMLCITKAMKLQGAGEDNTIISFGSAPSAGSIQYVPDETSLTNDYTFEVTGFTFDGQIYDASSGGLLNIQPASLITNVKIHDNTFKATHALITPGTSWENHSGNIWKTTITTKLDGDLQVAFNGTGVSASSPVASIELVNSANRWRWESNVLYVYSESDPDTAYTSPGISYGRRFNHAIVTNGPTYGVVYDNKFVDIGTMIKVEGGDSGPPNNKSWVLGHTAYGDANSFFFEDNTTSFTDAIVDDFGSTAGQGGSLVFRYNTINATNNTTGNELGDLHGLQSMSSSNSTCNNTGCTDSNCFLETTGGERCCDQWSQVKSEFYGNSWTNLGNNTGGYAYLIVHRGSKLLAFNNNMTGTLDAYYAPSVRYYATGCDGCQNPAGSPDYSMHIQQTYSFLNLYNGTEKPYNLYNDVCGDNVAVENGGLVITENTHYWNYVAAPTFDGTVGVGCGTLASRPETCTAGVGYWATTQSCSDISSYVGANTATPLSGILYICGATGWADGSTYTPYTYPHPLRGTGKATATIGSGSVMSIGSGATATLY